jgi:hypothetical protein
MAKVEIIKSLYEEIDKKFKGESIEVIKHLKSLEKSPNKGKLLSSVGNLVIKELKYKTFRFYFVTDGFKLRFLDRHTLKDLLIKFVAMSDKKHQQKVIEEIKKLMLDIIY